MSTSTPLPSSSHPQSLRLRRSHGFTLIELLTVIAIIGVLAAILFPVLGRVRENANSSRCTGNLRQIGAAIQTYTIDNKGKLPATGFFGVASYYNRDQRNFQNQILTYLDLNQASTWSTTSLTDMTHSEIFDCHGYKGATGGKSYTLHDTANATSADPALDVNGNRVRPWGLVQDAAGTTINPKPQKLIAMAPTTWAIRDNDVSTTERNHSGYQNTLYFDWHIGRVAVAN